MPDKGLGQLGDGLLFSAVVVYALAMLGFAGEQASLRARRTVTTVRKELVGAGGPALPPETVTTEAPSRAKLRSTRPIAGLPRAARRSASSMPWSTELRSRCINGSTRPFNTWPSIDVCAPAT